MRPINVWLMSEPLGNDRSRFCKNKCNISSQTWSEFTAKWKQLLQSRLAKSNQISLNGCFLQSTAAGFLVRDSKVRAVIWKKQSSQEKQTFSGTLYSIVHLGAGEALRCSPGEPSPWRGIVSLTFSLNPAFLCSLSQSSVREVQCNSPMC